MKDGYIKVLIPYSGCPKGRELYVTNIQDDGTAVCLNVNNPDDWTTYYIYKGDYEFVTK